MPRITSDSLKTSKLDNMEKKDYKKSLLEYHDVRDAMNVAREDGRKEGRELGREEAKCQLARNMLVEGLDPVVVAKITGLTEEEVKALVQKP